MSKCLCGCMQEVVWSGKGRKSRYYSEACKQKSKRVRANEKRVRLLQGQRSKLYVIPCDLDTANAFVSHLHRHNKPVPGAKFNLAIVDESGLLRGVAITGRPIARRLDDGLTLEVNRVCTDGCPNGCSALYGAARKVAFDLGYRRLVTYTLTDESGASMRGAGWHRISEVQGSDGWQSRPGRKSDTTSLKNKYRWETINPEYARNKLRPMKMILPEHMLMVSDHEQLDLFEEVV